MLRSNICFVFCLIQISTLLIGLVGQVLSEDSFHAPNIRHADSTSHDMMNHDDNKADNMENQMDVYQVHMPNVTTQKDDTYLCTDWSPTFSDKRYIIRYEAIPDNPNVHHMILYACDGRPALIGKAGQCNSNCLIYFAWARNAQPTILPKDVGFIIGDDVNYLQLQVHYRTVVTSPDQTKLLFKITNESMPKTAGVLLLVSNNFMIPSHSKQIVANVSCQYNDIPELHPFAFRTHTHMFGQVVSGYVVHNNKWSIIGKGNPKWPQAFWPVPNNDITIKKGDYLIAKCVYSSEDHDSNVHMGPTHTDEMCNYYVMYYQASENFKPADTCDNDQFPQLSKSAPKESTELLPPNPELEALGEGHSHGHHHTTTTETLSPEPVKDWPLLSNGSYFGQVSGVAVDNKFVYVAHRGERLWESDSFDTGNIFQKVIQGPILENVLIVLNSSSGVPTHFWGSNFFYMPHGLYVSNDRSVWITDVAMHQVFKFQLSSVLNGEFPKPSLTLGVKFVPGKDIYHFCKPADVVTNRTGFIFVADGYCNNRIMVFDRSGVFVNAWEVDTIVGLPHSITLDDIMGVVYVADRINARIMSYEKSGKFIKEFKHAAFKPQLFALTYSETKGKLFCVNGDISVQSNHMKSYQIMVVEPVQQKILSNWSLPTLHNPLSTPHDIAVSPDGSFVVVVIVDYPGKILKYDSASSMDFGLKVQTSKKLGVTYHRRPVGKVNGEYGNIADGIEDRKYKLTLIFIVVLCLFVLPLSVIVGVAIYLKNKRKDCKGYSHLEAAQQVNRRYAGKSTGDVVRTFVTGKSSIPETIREEELKRLESESEEEFSMPNFKPGQI